MKKKMIVLIIALSLLLSACNVTGTIHDKFITPMQQHQGIPTNCSVIC